MKILFNKTKVTIHQNQNKFLFLICLVLVSASSFSQTNDVPMRNFKNDYRKMYEQKFDNPIFLTNDNVLLNFAKVDQLDWLKKIKSLNVIQHKEGQKVFGELAKNGLVILELQDTIIESENLIDLLKRSYPEKFISMANVSINGLSTNDEKIKFPKWDKLNLDFYSQSNKYNIKAD